MAKRDEMPKDPEVDYDRQNLRMNAVSIVVAWLGCLERADASALPGQSERVKNDCPDVVKAAAALLTSEFTKALPPAVPTEVKKVTAAPGSAFDHTGD
jgi:hypothetical protein